MNGYFYLLSNFQTNANNAQSVCARSGGTLAEVSNNATKTEFIQFATEKLIPSGRHAVYNFVSKRLHC